MEWYYSEHYKERQGRQAEWFRQKNHNDQNVGCLTLNGAIRHAVCRSSDEKKLHPHATNSLPLTNYWFQILPLLERTHPPPTGFLGSTNSADHSRMIETPKTPPSFGTASFRQRCMASEPISPPNLLRLASTIATQCLPRPDTSPRFLFPRFDYESVGDPHLLVYRVRLPDFLIRGKLDVAIAAAEAYASRLPNGWKTNIFTLTKCDIACQDIPGIPEFLGPIMTYITLAMKFLYCCPVLTMGVNQPHIVKYAPDIGHTGGTLDHALLWFDPRNVSDPSHQPFVPLISLCFMQFNYTAIVVILRPTFLYRPRTVTREVVPISPQWTNW